MADWQYTTNPTADFKFDTEQYSPNGKIFTLKGVRNSNTGTQTTDTLVQGMTTFFDIFGLTIPTVPLYESLGEKTAKSKLERINNS